MFSKILAANDGSPGALRALEAAISLAKQHQAELHMITVEALSRFPASIDEVDEEKFEANHRFAPVIEAARSQAKAARVKLEIHLVPGHVVEGIVEFINAHRIDLLVIGFMGHSRLYERIIGSTTDRLVRLAPCSVLVVK
jgi:nucleotide-binding universal stress UspA family protein